MRLFGGSYWLCEHAREASCAPAADLFVQRREPRGGKFRPIGFVELDQRSLYEVVGIRKAIIDSSRSLVVKGGRGPPKVLGQS